MRRLAIVCGLALAASPAAAAEPTGEWVVANGHAHVSIENCGGAYWGAISWEERPGGRDTENPDPAKRNQPTLGLPILLDMTPTDPNRWEGHVYNAENGHTYSASITLRNPNTLHIEGCVLGFLCGGEDWSRLQPSEQAQEPRSRTRSSAPRTSGSGGKATSSAKPNIDVCSRVSDVTGRGRR